MAIPARNSQRRTSSRALRSARYIPRRTCLCSARVKGSFGGPQVALAPECPGARWPVLALEK
eukprot:8956551-Alexandrium_andersonii.AAC.1